MPIRVNESPADDVRHARRVPLLDGGMGKCTPIRQKAYRKAARKTEAEMNAWAERIPARDAGKGWDGHGGQNQRTFKAP